MIIKDFNNFIFEKYKFHWYKVSKYEYSFNKDNIEYSVCFEPINSKENKFELSFGVIEDESTKYSELNKGDVFKILSTISDIVKNFIEANDDVLEIRFYGIENNSNPASDFIMDKILKYPIISWMLMILVQTISRPIQWTTKPTQRTKIFKRWTKKGLGMEWKVRQVGNEIVIKRLDI